MAAVQKYIHTKTRSKKLERVLPASFLFLVFIGVFALLLSTSFFKSYAYSEDSNSALESNTDYSINIGAEPAIDSAPPLLEGPEPLYGDIYVPVRTNTEIWLNTPLLKGSAYTPFSSNEASQVKCMFISGSGTPLIGYTWGCDIPETNAVEGEYFADTVFIGNSIEEGFMLYSGLTAADFFAAKSITVMNIGTDKAVNAGGGEYITILDALGRKEYSKVYILLGLNEIGYGIDVFCQRYSDLIDTVRELQPDAEVYIQSLTPVSKRQSESGSIFNNESIGKHNKALMELALEKQSHYVNIYEALADNEGCLPEGGSYDGIHPYTKYYVQWYDYLKTHTVTETHSFCG